MQVPFRRVFAACTLLVLAGAVRPGAAATADAPRLGVSPLLVDAAADVWRVIATDDNPVWPGWNAAGTPLLLYLPGRQDLLIGHPSPPAGFAPYHGPLSFPGEAILVRDDTTLVNADGQNTSMDIHGVRTLVVADPLSNLRQTVGGLLTDPRPAAEKARTLKFTTLAADPYEQLALIVHEAFHVHQDHDHPDRGGNEGLLVIYPVLSVDNNVGFGLEAGALAEAIEAPDVAAARRAAVRWLAVREHRRALLPARAVQYEDGTEFSEGLAKYTEYRLWQVLEGREPSPGLARAQGFQGYGDLSGQRRMLLDRMRAQMRGEVNVNNSPYGTAPARMRLYYSGMGQALVLDRLMPGWTKRFWAGDSSLTDMLRDALAASPAELAAGWDAARADTAYAPLRAAKEALARDGARDAAERLADFGRGPGTRLVVDFGRLDSHRVGLAFTPFGITRIDTARVIFDQVPISAHFADGSELREAYPLPLLRDTLRREVHVRLEKPVTLAELVRLAGGPVSGAAPRAMELSLPGANLSLRRATLRWSAGEIRVVLWPGEAPAPAARDSAAHGRSGSGS
jgi:hypothetical protein